MSRELKILVVGSGGREHALVWKLAQSPRVQTLYCAPGNPGIAKLAQCISIPADDIPSLLAFAKERRIGLTVVGPELPLTLGLVDAFAAEGLPAAGPTRAAARLESSKVFAKEFMLRHRIPTAPARIFSAPEPAIQFIRQHGAPIVVKVDGLAAGKGVVVAQEEAGAVQAIETFMRRKIFGEAGNRVILEDCLAGEEATLLVFTDGRTAVPMAAAQDHKRVYDHDLGPNTGGMGAFAPAPILSDRLRKKVMKEVVEPALAGLAEEGCPYRGVLYVGLMLTSEGPRVLEFNARFGDPEAQAVLPLLETDLVEILLAIVEGRLDRVKVGWKAGAAVCVVLASKGYPATPEVGFPISGIGEAEADSGVLVFHAGTAIKDGQTVTAGGRVLGVTAVESDLPRAREKAYRAVEKIRFQGMQHRRDIALKAAPTASAG
jgi:phosphoribosylamine--glycine ligase